MGESMDFVKKSTFLSCTIFLGKIKQEKILFGVVDKKIFWTRQRKF